MRFYISLRRNLWGLRQLHSSNHSVGKSRKPDALPCFSIFCSRIGNDSCPPNAIDQQAPFLGETVCFSSVQRYRAVQSHPRSQRFTPSYEGHSHGHLCCAKSCLVMIHATLTGPLLVEILSPPWSADPEAQQGHSPSSDHHTLCALQS